nr:hypothetical protein [Opitutaceae bacterium]
FFASLTVQLPLPAAEFAPVFTAGAVLQREQPIPIWGTGRDGETITVELLDKSATTTVSSGRWSVTLPALPATASTTLRLRGDTTRELADIAIGEVWFGLGQSNMEWRLNQCAPFTDALLASADNPAIRQLKIPLRPYAGDPLSPFAWKKFDRASAGQFSAVGYYFAAELHRRLGVVVGIVNCAYGGTPIEAWMSREAIAAAGSSALLAEHDRKMAAWSDFAVYDKAWRDYDAARKAYEARKKANPADPALGAAPVEPYGHRSKGRPAGLRESMLALVTPYAARGALWYQGENNAGRPGDYRRLLAGLLAELRADRGRPDWPVFIGQLSSPTANWPDDQDGYAIIREAQRAVAADDARSGLVVTLDHGERGNVHPKQKQPVGERFARLALARAYGLAGFAAQSPAAVSAARVADGRVEIRFAELPGRLVLRDPSLPTLELADAAGVWRRPSLVTLSADGQALLVTPAAEASAPKAVRYAWRNFCPLTLFTDEDLPVSPWSIPVSL